MEYERDWEGQSLSNEDYDELKATFGEFLTRCDATLMLDVERCLNEGIYPNKDYYPDYVVYFDLTLAPLKDGEESSLYYHLGHLNLARAIEEAETFMMKAGHRVYLAEIFERTSKKAYDTGEPIYKSLIVRRMDRNGWHSRSKANQEYDDDTRSMLWHGMYGTTIGSLSNADEKF